MDVVILNEKFLFLEIFEFFRIIVIKSKCEVDVWLGKLLINNKMISILRFKVRDLKFFNFE